MDAKRDAGLRVLIVDDEASVRGTLKLLLECDGHLVEEAENAKDALHMLEGASFDMIITDYEMAGMRGDQLVAAIKAQAPKQPVIMLTAYGEAVASNPSLMKSLDGLVTKPFRMEELREAVAKATVGQRRGRAEQSP